MNKPPTGKDGSDVVIITKHENNCFFRFECVLCGGSTDKQDYLYELQGDHDAIVCDECAEQPERVSARMRECAQHLRERATELEARATVHYVTDHRLRWSHGPIMSDEEKREREREFDGDTLEAPANETPSE